MDILVSAHNPMTGPRHLGHYVSTMMEWPNLQKKHECFFVIDDLIASFMYPKARSQIFNRALFTARDFLASGIDTENGHIVFTSSLWENSELLLLLSNYIDMALCERLFDRSFLGMLSPQQRSQMKLSPSASAAEYLYPALGMPALTLGLQAKAFQGGEEISGYVYIMEQIAKQFSAEHGEALSAPAWLKPATPYLSGTDGTHMTTHNAIILSNSDAAFKGHSGSASIPDTVLSEWASALGESALSTRLSKDPSAGRGAILEAVERHCAPYRKFDITNDAILNHAAKGAARAKYLLRDTLSRLKRAMQIPEILEYA